MRKKVSTILYRLTHDVQRKYCYAYKDMSLVKYTRSICPQCNRPVVAPEFNNEIPHLILEGGTTYPDFLQFCGAGKQLLLVSEKTLNLYEISRVSGYSGYQNVAIEMVHNSKSITVPSYYNLDISGKIDLDTVAMHIKKKRSCSVCGQFEWSRMRLEPIILNRASWDRSDLCLIESIPGFRVCSEKIKELALTHKLTGFSFRESL